MFEQQTLLINKVLNKIDRCLQKKKKKSSIRSFVSVYLKLNKNLDPATIVFLPKINLINFR